MPKPSPRTLSTQGLQVAAEDESVSRGHEDSEMDIDGEGLIGAAQDVRPPFLPLLTL